MKHKNPHITRLIDSCMQYVEEIAQISREIAAAISENKLENVESLIQSRGKAIDSIISLETQLQQIPEINDPSYKPDIDRYGEKRTALSQIIQNIEQQIITSITESQESVLSEIKALYRGRKMNDGYFNPKTPPPTFLDIKE